MSPTEPPEGIDWRQVVSIVFDVACAGYLLWTLSPTVRITVTGILSKMKADVRARQRAEHDRRWMDWTLYEIRNLPEAKVA